LGPSQLYLFVCLLGIFFFTAPGLCMNTHTLNGSQRSKLKQILILEFDQKGIVLESQTRALSDDSRWQLTLRGMPGGDVEGEGRRGGRERREGRKRMCDSLRHLI